MIAAPVFALVFGSHMFIAVAGGLPTFDTAPGCRAAVDVMSGSFETCMRDEQDARSQLAAQWEKFAAADRVACGRNATTGGFPSYVDLLTCLEMARDVRALPENATDGSNR